MRLKLSVLLLLVCSVAHADTNTPLPAGTSVTVTSSAGSVTGVLQDIDVPNWIAVLEPGRSSPALIRAADVIIRQTAQVPADGITRPRISIPKGRLPFDLVAPFAARDEAPSLEFELERAQPTGHFIYGQPKISDPSRFSFTPDGEDDSVDGITILSREAFTLGHFDYYRVPAWVAMRWTEDDYYRSEAVTMQRGDFVIDEDLPWYGRGGTYLEYARTGLQRGHMARDADLEAWGFDSVREGMRMSNIVPQQEHMNHAVWGDLENEHRRIVTRNNGIDTVWIISGPVFNKDDDEVEWVGNDGEKLGVPEATYKVIAWLPRFAHREDRLRWPMAPAKPEPGPDQDLHPRLRLARRGELRTNPRSDSRRNQLSNGPARACPKSRPNLRHP